MKLNKINYQGKNCEYYSNKEIKEMYPEGGYFVLGEITNKVGKIKDMPLSDKKGNTLFVQPLGTYKHPIYKKLGCMWSDEAEGFIIVKKSTIGRLCGYSVLAIVLVLGLFFGIKYLMNQSNLDPNAMPYESTIKRSEDMDESRILVPGYNDWNMMAGSDEIYVALYNPDENPCYFQFSIILDETEEVLFKTGLVPPGQAVTTVKLPRVFEEGVYPVTINIHSFSLNDNSQKLNGGEVKTHIVALSE